MTINELEQGLRNLIASQQAILSGPIGETLRGLLNITESYREFMFRLQTYPAQDVFLMQTSNSAKRFESEITSLAVSTLQTKGINLLLYVPQNSFGTINQMPYANGAMQNNSIYDTQTNAYQTPYVNNIAENNVEVQEHKPTGKPTFAGSSITKRASLDSTDDGYNKITKRKPSETHNIETKPIVEQEPEKTETIEASENTSGRDYLLELLKK